MKWCSRFLARDNTLLQMKIVINNIINIFHYQYTKPIINKGL
ncbi:hypothetical protein SEHO0A_00536 [Salmonella enterica subsp. houtenae str. ATCC BAA-1581]|nr:hypothetical protein SEHO0A_00536 [Salmonella enterica subsp. houtenae str. ATCC BAA-1581]ENZ87913.1 hypothetical protein D088_890077 [Salmonella enterica subsp. houtenae serovar 16:z4,z32:-- str. RKS3027]